MFTTDENGHPGMGRCPWSNAGAPQLLPNTTYQRVGSYYTRDPRHGDDQVEQMQEDIRHHGPDNVVIYDQQGIVEIIVPVKS